MKIYMFKNNIWPLMIGTFFKNASLKWIWKVLIKNIPFNWHMQAQKSENIYIKRNCVILQNWSLCTLVNMKKLEYFFHLWGVEFF